MDAGEARTEGRASAVAEVLVVLGAEGDGTWKHDLLSNASLTTPLAEYARVLRRNTGSRRRMFAAGKGKRVWLWTMKSALDGGITIELWHSWRRGS